MFDRFRDFLNPPSPQGRLKDLETGLEAQDKKNAKLEEELAHKEAEAAVKEKLTKARAEERRLRGDIAGYTGWVFTPKRILIIVSSLVVLGLLIKACS